MRFLPSKPSTVATARVRPPTRPLRTMSPLSTPLSQDAMRGEASAFPFAHIPAPLGRTCMSRPHVERPIPLLPSTDSTIVIPPSSSHHPHAYSSITPSFRSRMFIVCPQPSIKSMPHLSSSASLRANYRLKNVPAKLTQTCIPAHSGQKGAIDPARTNTHAALPKPVASLRKRVTRGNCENPQLMIS